MAEKLDSWDLLSEAEDGLIGLESALNQTLEHIPRADITVPDPPLPESDYQDPWQQLPDEPSTSYRQFLIYRDIGLTRTITAAAKKARSTQPSLSRLAKTFNWRHRVQAWDSEQERLYQLARHEKVREMVDRHGEIIETAISHLALSFQALQQRIDSDPDFVEDLSKREATFLLKIADGSAKTLPSLLAAERLARDMPTELVGGVVEHQHVIEIDQDSLGDVIATLERAGVLARPGNQVATGEVVEAEVVDVHPVPDSGPSGESEDGAG